MRGVVFQAAGVAKGLFSVEKMNECGHVVIFDGDDSIIVHKKLVKLISYEGKVEML